MGIDVVSLGFEQNLWKVGNKLRDVATSRGAKELDMKRKGV